MDWNRNFSVVEFVHSLLDDYDYGYDGDFYDRYRGFGGFYRPSVLSVGVGVGVGLGLPLPLPIPIPVSIPSYGGIEQHIFFFYRWIQIALKIETINLSV